MESELLVYLLRAAARLLYNLPPDGGKITSQSIQLEPTANSLTVVRVQNMLSMCFRMCVGPYTEDSTNYASKVPSSGTRSGNNNTEIGVALLCSAFLRDQLTNLFLETKVENSNISPRLVSLLAIIVR